MPTIPACRQKMFVGDSYQIIVTNGDPKTGKLTNVAPGLTGIRMVNLEKKNGVERMNISAECR